MSRIIKIIPVLLAGAVSFSGVSFAHDGNDPSFVTYADDADAKVRAPRRADRPRVAQTPIPPKPPKPPKPPVPPTPPTPPGVSISINGNKIDISGIDGMVKGQLDGVREMIRNNPNIPKPIKDKLMARLDKVRATVDKRLAKIKTKGIDKMGEELEQMGEEIEQALEGLDEELEQLGDKVSKDLGKKFKNKKFNFDFDHDDDDDEDDEDVADAIPMTPDLDDVDSDGMRDALNDLRGMAIKPDQKDKIARIRAESDKNVGNARKQLEELSKKLETALGDARTSDADIARMVDQISAQEAAIRKARILAWVNARRVLDDTQRKRIEAAAAKKRSK